MNHFFTYNDDNVYFKLKTQTKNMYIFLTIILNLIAVYTHIFSTSKPFVWLYTVSEVYISPLVFALKLNTRYTSAIAYFFPLNTHLSIDKPGFKFNALVNTVYICPHLMFNAHGKPVLFWKGTSGLKFPCFLFMHANGTGPFEFRAVPIL